MPSTFILFLALIALAVFAVVVIAWGMFFILFTRRRSYGAKTLTCGCLGGIGIMLTILALRLAFRSSDNAPSFETLLVVFGAGFGLAGGFYAVVGFFSPLFSYNNRWSARKRVANNTRQVLNLERTLDD